MNHLIVILIFLTITSVFSFLGLTIEIWSIFNVKRYDRTLGLLKSVILLGTFLFSTYLLIFL
jgi:hypothetical protein